MKRNLFKIRAFLILLFMVGLFSNIAVGQTPTVVNITPTTTLQTWIMPAGVTEFDIEVWGAGANGSIGVEPEFDSGPGGGGGGYVKVTGVKAVASITIVSIIDNTTTGRNRSLVKLYDSSPSWTGDLIGFSPFNNNKITGGQQGDVVVSPSQANNFTSVSKVAGGNGGPGVTGVSKEGGNGGNGGGAGGGAGGTVDSPNGETPGGGGMGAGTMGSTNELIGYGGAGLVRITYILPILPSITTTFTQVPPICRGASLAPLPTTSTNMPTGITGTWAPAIINNLATTTYTFTPAPGQDASTATMTIVVNAPAAPTASPQSFCPSATVANLAANGTALQWYAASTGGTALAPSTRLTAGTYYVSQTVNGCESARTAVSVSINTNSSGNLSANLSAAGTTACTGTITATLSTTPTYYTNNFPTSPTGTTSIGFNAFWESGSNFIKLTANENEKKGYLYITALPFYSTIKPNYLELNFRAFMLNKSGADGFSVTISSDINVNSPNAFEDGLIGSSNQGLVLKFKTFNQDRVELFYNGSQVGTTQNYTLEDGNWKDYKVTIKPNNTLTLVIAGTTIFNNVTLPSYTNLNPNIAFAARTGGSSNEHIIDDIVIKDLRSYEYSLDNATWQTANTFTNKATGTYTVYGRLPGMTCGEALGNVTVVGSGTRPTPTFNQVAPICKGATLADLPTSSTNTTAITGTWAPAINNMATTTYTFTPTAGVCANTVTMTIVVNEPITPTFTQVDPICKGAALAALPTTSTNNITGTWEPATNNMATTTYTFTPTAGQCANTATMTVTVNEPITPTFTSSTVVLDKINTSSVSNDTPFEVPIAATYRIELWGKGGKGENSEFMGSGGSAGGYTATEVLLMPGNYAAGFVMTTGYFYTRFLKPSELLLVAYDGFGNSPTSYNSTATGGTKNIKGGIGAIKGGGAAGWWGHNGASLDGTSTAGGDSGTPDNSSDGGAPSENGKFPGGGGGSGMIGGSGGGARILISKIEPISPTICKGSTTNPLPNTSAEGITGTWSPAFDNMATITYTFTPDAGQCANTATLTITVNEPVTTTFTQVAPICKGDILAALPISSIEGITGTWLPALNNQATTTYTFTPAAGQCGSTATMEIVVNQPVLITSGPILGHTVCEGDNKTFTITATGTITGYQWKKGATAITGATNASLSLSNVSTDDISTYTVEVTGACGSKSYGPINLNVTQKPVVPEVSGSTVFSVNVDNIGTCPDFRGVYAFPVQQGPAITFTNTSNGAFKLEYFNQQWNIYMAGFSGPIITNTNPMQGGIPPETGWVLSPGFNCTNAPVTVTTLKQLTFCEGATVFNLKQNLPVEVNGLSLKFYDSNNNLIYGSNSDVLTSGNISITQTIASCESAKLPILITVQIKRTPTFNQIEPICKGSNLQLPPISNEGFSGTWSPTFNNQATGTYTFNASSGFCANTATMTVVVNEPVTPTFTQVEAICKGANLADLPTSSNNTMAIAGSWAPAINNQATTTYTFTPTAGQCANTTTMTVVVNDCSQSIISGTIYEDTDGGTIDGTPLTVSGVYLSIYPTTSALTGPINPLHVVPVESGNYAFPALPAGKYKIVIGTANNGSETPTYPNIGGFSTIASAEGEAGTMGDGTPDGITFVTISEGATVYSGSRVRADAGVSFALQQSTPLPVRLVSFTGKSTEKGNQLNWETANEKNFSHFEVERSTNTKAFVKIEKVDGNKGEVYEFVDASINNELSYYRLKMVDLDGSFAYSKVISIGRKSKTEVFGYPNPASNKLFVYNLDDLDIITIYTAKGIQLKSEKYNAANGIEVSNLSSGIYFVKTKYKTLKIIKN